MNPYLAIIIKGKIRKFEKKNEEKLMKSIFQLKNLKQLNSN